MENRIMQAKHDIIVNRLESCPDKDKTELEKVLKEIHEAMGRIQHENRH